EEGQVELGTGCGVMRAGGIAAGRVGRQWRFRKGDLDAWLESQRPGGAPAASLVPRRLDGARRVLVVDDEESIRELLTKTLALAEYEVHAVGDGRSALDLLRREPWDLLIADLRMPHMDGLSLIREARLLHAALAVIIVTGHSTESSAIQAVNLGVVGYLVKPFRIQQVLTAVARALGDSD